MYANFNAVDGMLGFCSEIGEVVIMNSKTYDLYFLIFMLYKFGLRENTAVQWDIAHQAIKRLEKRD